MSGVFWWKLTKGSEIWVGLVEVDGPASRSSMRHLSLYNHDTSECWPMNPSRCKLSLLKSSVLTFKVDHRYSGALHTGDVAGKMPERFGNCSSLVCVR